MPANVSQLTSTVLVAILLSTPVAALDDGPARLPDTALEEIIVTATRRDAPLGDFAGSITRLGSEEIGLVGSTHHAEILNRVAGTMIQRGSGEESLTAIRSPVLTGPGSCGAFLFLEDSVPIRPVGFCNVNELFEINTEQARAIEVQRGPASALYGSSAMHGAVNVLQPDPSQMPRHAVGLEGGADDYWRGRIALSRSGSTTDAGTSAVVTHDGGWREASGFDEQKLNAALVRRLDESLLRVRLAATRLDQETAGFIQGEDAYRDDEIARSNPNPEAYRRAHAIRLTAHWERLLNQSTRLDLRPYLRSSRMEFLQHFLLGKPLEKNGQESAGLLLAIDHTGATGTRWLGGFDLELADTFLLEVQEAPTTDGPPIANAIRPPGRHYDYDVTSSVLAAYGHVEQPLSSALMLTAGLRAEHVRYDYDNRMIAGNTDENGVPCPFGGCLYSRPDDRNDSFTNLVPKLGLSWRLAPSTSLHVSAVRGYRAPETTELYRLQRQQNVADLDPERLSSLELGLRGQLRDLRYALSGFLMEKRNVIFRDSNAFNVSDGRTRHRGLEYELSWSPLDALTITAAGTYARHTYDFTGNEGAELIEPGNDVDTAPRHLHGARIAWRVVASAQAELEWQHVSSYWLDASNQHRYGGHDLVNLRLAWDVSDRWRLAARITNLTDEAYADRADFAFGSYRYFPGRGRALFLEASYSQP